jgi:hypothetical protein
MRHLGFHQWQQHRRCERSLISSNHRYGFEYELYLARPRHVHQLWAMHLSFITLANLYRLLDRGKVTSSR